MLQVQVLRLNCFNWQAEMKIFKTDDVVKPTPDSGKGALFWQNKMFFYEN